MAGTLPLVMQVWLISTVHLRTPYLRMNVSSQKKLYAEHDQHKWQKGCSHIDGWVLPPMPRYEYEHHHDSINSHVDHYSDYSRYRERQLNEKFDNLYIGRAVTDFSHVDIPVFRGSSDVHEYLYWILETEDIVNDLPYSDATKCKLVQDSFVGIARSWWEELQEQRRQLGLWEVTSWNVMRKQLRKRFYDESYHQQKPHQLHRSFQGKRKISAYADEFQLLVFESFLRENSEEVLELFLNRMNQDIAAEVRKKPLFEFCDTVLSALEEERQLNEEAKKLIESNSDPLLSGPPNSSFTKEALSVRETSNVETSNFIPLVQKQVTERPLRSREEPAHIIIQIGSLDITVPKEHTLGEQCKDQADSMQTQELIEANQVQNNFNLRSHSIIMVEGITNFNHLHVWKPVASILRKGNKDVALLLEITVRAALHQPQKVICYPNVYTKCGNLHNSQGKDQLSPRHQHPRFIHSPDTEIFEALAITKGFCSCDVYLQVQLRESIQLFDNKARTTLLFATPFVHLQDCCINPGNTTGVEVTPSLLHQVALIQRVVTPLSEKTKDKSTGYINSQYRYLVGKSSSVHTIQADDDINAHAEEGKTPLLMTISMVWSLLREFRTSTGLFTDYEEPNFVVHSLAYATCNTGTLKIEKGHVTHAWMLNEDRTWCHLPDGTYNFYHQNGD